MLEGDSTAPGFIRIGEGDTFPRTRVIITGVAINQKANVQFMETLRDRIYIYSFGDRLGDMQVMGLGLKMCDDTDEDSSVKDLDTFYQNNKASVLNSDIVITIDRVVTFRAFLLAMTTQLVNEEFRTVGFTLTLKVLPRRNLQVARIAALASEVTGEATVGFPDEATAASGQINVVGG